MHFQFQIGDHACFKITFLVCSNFNDLLGELVQALTKNLLTGSISSWRWVFKVSEGSKILSYILNRYSLLLGRFFVSQH